MLIAILFIVAVVVVLMEFHRRLKAVEDRMARLENVRHPPLTVVAEAREVIDEPPRPGPGGD
jgi:hypothetical protein